MDNTTPELNRLQIQVLRQMAGGKNWRCSHKNMNELVRLGYCRNSEVLGGPTNFITEKGLEFVRNHSGLTAK
jgi:hypothetical protein